MKTQLFELSLKEEEKVSGIGLSQYRMFIASNPPVILKWKGADSIPNSFRELLPKTFELVIEDNEGNIITATVATFTPTKENK